MKVASIGECMVELSPRPGGQFALGFGGDTLNTAVYMARLGVAVDYLTALGDDRFSERMVRAWSAEGVGIGGVRRLAGRLPGLYLIETDDRGERHFSYWRDRAPARELFQPDSGAEIARAIEGYDMVYLSGISLSLYGDDGRRTLFAALDAQRRRGGRVAFDSNFRPRNWPDTEAARAAMQALLARADMALVGFDDEQALWGDTSPAQCAKRIAALGPAEVVVKNAAAPALVLADGTTQSVAAESGPPPVDTTAAGDSFNAAYLAARLKGIAAAEAARAGHRLAAAVIRHPGAIIPRQAMPESI